MKKQIKKTTSTLKKKNNRVLKKPDNSITITQETWDYMNDHGDYLK